MPSCIKPCLLFSVVLFINAIALTIWLGDVSGQLFGQQNTLNVSIQLGSVLFGLVCLICHWVMLKTNGYFICGSSNRYLFHMLVNWVLFAVFTIAFMISHAWAADRLLHLGVFLVFDALQCVFVGLSLFSQKSAFDDFIMKAMKLNTNHGNPIDARTASRLYKLKYGRNKSSPANDLETDRLKTYLMPSEGKDDRIKNDPEEDAKNEGYYYAAPLVAL